MGALLKSRHQEEKEALLKELADLLGGKEGEALREKVEALLTLRELGEP